MLLQGTGVALIALGFGLLAVWAGVVTGGLGLVLMGIAGEVERR
jgi:hypothetical protein